MYYSLLIHVFNKNVTKPTREIKTATTKGYFQLKKKRWLTLCNHNRTSIINYTTLRRPSKIRELYPATIEEY